MIKSSVEGDYGFYSELVIASEDLEEIRKLIWNQYIKVLGNFVEEKRLGVFKNTEIDKYHTLINDEEHKLIWSKESRMLNRPDVTSFKKLKFIKTLEDEFGPLEISDEEKVGYDNVYWRMVRPGKKCDIGPVHADYMFWELAESAISQNKKRIKVWIPIFSEKGLSGLNVAAGSHLLHQQYGGEKRDGKIKPKLLGDTVKIQVELHATEPGRCIIFNDRLLHGGNCGGNLTRISIEFTVLIGV